MSQTVEPTVKNPASVLREQYGCVVGGSLVYTGTSSGAPSGISIPGFSDAPRSRLALGPKERHSFL